MRTDTALARNELGLSFCNILSRLGELLAMFPRNVFVDKVLLHVRHKGLITMKQNELRCVCLHLFPGKFYIYIYIKFSIHICIYVYIYTYMCVCVRIFKYM